MLNSTSLQIIEYKLGQSEPTEKGQKLTVQYAAALSLKDLETGKYIDSSWKKKAVTFTLGNGEVLRGLDQGLVGMRLGGTRRIIIPPELAFGEKGITGKIPPNSSLVFEVYLADIE